MNCAKNAIRESGRVFAALAFAFLLTTGLRAGTVSVGWSAVDDASVVGYRVLHASDGGPLEPVADVAADVTSFTLSELEDCAEHRVSVRSVDGVGNESPDPAPIVEGWPRPRITGLAPGFIEAGGIHYLFLDGANFREGAEVVVESSSIEVSSVYRSDCGRIRALVRLDADAPLGPVRVVVSNAPDGGYGETTVDVVPGGYGASDADGDGVVNLFDNCLGAYNPDQSDADGDAIGDACDLDPGGLLAHWTMDEASVVGDRLVDATGNGRDGFIDGATLADGFVGEALAFDGAIEAHVRVPQMTDSSPPAALTVAAWIRPDSYGEGNGGSVADSFDRLLGGGWALQTFSSNQGLRVYGLSHLTALYSDSSSVEIGRWQHVAAAYVGRRVKIYRDGRLVGSRHANHAPLETLTELMIGNNATLDGAFTGRIDDLRVYDLALNEAEIGALVAQAAAPLCGDGDGDGYPFPGHPACQVQEADCDDTADGVNPGADEVCGDGIDQDCDGVDLECPCLDVDGDGYLDAACGGQDCDDDDRDRYPGAPETCDDFDDDCDGLVDEDGVCGTEGLMAHWTMDAETLSNGTVADVSGRGHDGQAFGGPTAVGGRHGGALRFVSGLNQYIRVPDHVDLDLEGRFTIAAWIYPESYGQAQLGAIVDKMYLPSVQGYALSVTNQSLHQKKLMLLGISLQSPRYSESGAVSVNVWQHVAVVYEDGVATFYRDGETMGSVDAIHDANPGTRWLYIGNNSSRSRDFHGSIDDVRIYRRALSAEEIRWLAE